MPASTVVVNAAEHGKEVTPGTMAAPDATLDRNSMDEDAPRLIDEQEGFSAEAQDMHFDNLAATGYALARSVTLLPMFRIDSTTAVSLESAWRKSLTETCTQQERNCLEHALRMFLIKPARDARRTPQTN